MLHESCYLGVLHDYGSSVKLSGVCSVLLSVVCLVHVDWPHCVPSQLIIFSFLNTSFLCTNFIQIKEFDSHFNESAQSYFTHYTLSASASLAVLSLGIVGHHDELSSAVGSGWTLWL